MWPRKTPSNSISFVERERVLEIANSEEFRDLSPKQIVPLLADRGQYVASESTFYRVLRAEKLLAHRGKARAPVSRPKPELEATGANEVYSWDITLPAKPGPRGILLFVLSRRRVQSAHRRLGGTC